MIRLTSAAEWTPVERFCLRFGVCGPAPLTASVRRNTMTPQQFAKLTDQHKHDVRGSLRIFGEWFGRPHDNCHELMSMVAEADSVILGFDQGESLQVWSPSDPEFVSHRFAIRSASHVRWEWYYYGRPHLPQNRYFLDYIVAGKTVDATTNVDWYSPALHPSLHEYAVILD